MGSLFSKRSPPLSAPSSDGPDSVRSTSSSASAASSGSHVPCGRLVAGFPDTDGELPLNGFYEYAGSQRGFASYRTRDGAAVLYLDHSDGYWSLNATLEEGRCAAFSTEGQWLNDPPSAGWLVSQRYLGGGGGYEPYEGAGVKGSSPQHCLLDLQVAGFPPHSGLNGAYLGVEAPAGNYFQCGDHYLRHVEGLWSITKGGLDTGCELAYSRHPSVNYSPPLPPSREWTLGTRPLPESSVPGPSPLPGCIAFIPRPRRSPPSAAAPDPCAACGATPDNWGALVTHQRQSHGHRSVALPADVLVHVFLFVPHRRLGTAALVSSAWYAAYSSDPLWRTTAPALLPFFHWQQSFYAPEEQFAESGCLGTIAADFYAETRVGPPEPADVSCYAKFQQALAGERTCLAQVFDKHLREGFKMTAYDVFCFCRSLRWWNVYYLQPRVPRTDSSRDYFAAELVALHRLRPLGPDCAGYDPYAPHFPHGADPAAYRTWGEGTDVEIQYRFREEDPYGWWKGVVQQQRRLEDGSWGVEVHFPQYKSSVKWESEVVFLGRKHLKPPQFEKQQSVGGIRLCTDEQRRQWDRRRAVWRF